MTSIAVLIATGEAWSDAEVPGDAPQPFTPPDPSAAVAATALPALPAAQPLPSPQPLPATFEPPVAAAPAAVPSPRISGSAPPPTPESAAGEGPRAARSSLQAALADLLPVMPAVAALDAQPHVLPAETVPVAEPVARRIQLGFRDGSSTTLDPASSQALALEELAQTLTRRD